MKFVILAGTPGSGKTSILINLIKELIKKQMKPSVIKIDCLWTDDDIRLKNLNVPLKIGLSRDMCPDHFSIYNIEDMIIWANENDSNILLVETAGLCLRCSPYIDKSIAICVIDMTIGPNTPLKIGPLLTEADIVVMTKGDIISQAEREVFRERIIESNPKCKIIESNGLTGKGCAELSNLIDKNNNSIEFSRNSELDIMNIRCNPPFSICTLCSGEKRINKKYQRGILRSIDGFNEYIGE